VADFVSPPVAWTPSPRGVALPPKEGENCILHPDVETPLDETGDSSLKNVQESPKDTNVSAAILFGDSTVVSNNF
jgi:hypothetical protein